MYAVERLSSYITRGVYTVSGPFHPFGGAVDIIVVQQQDGSFKSSPWYVRFGKFQGVLKTKEKVVNICVNEVDAGFHMYLDHKGEAYFLKESNSEDGGEFVPSPPSSGDEIDEKARSLLFKQAESCNFDGIQEESVASVVENGNAKIVARTNTRRSRIFGLFGRKSMKESNNSSDVGRVSSMERAEIAADLLDVKWSTNLPATDRRDHNSLESSSEHIDIDAGKTDGEVASNCGEGMDNDSFRTSIVSEEHMEEVIVHASPSVQADEVVLEINKSESMVLTQEPLGTGGIDAMTKESVSKDHVSDNLSPGLYMDNTSGESVASNGEKSGDNLGTEMVRELHTEETSNCDSSSTTHEEVVRIYTSESGEPGDKGEIISRSVVIGSDECNVLLKGSLNNSTFDAQSGGSTVLSSDNEQVVKERDDGQKEVTSFSYRETLESSIVSVGVSTDQAHGATDIAFGGDKEYRHHSSIFYQTSEVICVVNSQNGSDACTDRQNHEECHDQDLELPIVKDSLVIENRDVDPPTNEVLVDKIAKDSNGDSSTLSDSYQSEVMYEDEATDEAPQERGTGIRPVEFVGNQLQMKEGEPMELNSHRTLCSEKKSELTSNIGLSDSFVSIVQTHEVETLGEKVNMEKSSLPNGVEESLNHEQLLFGDVGSFGSNEVEPGASFDNLEIETGDDHMLLTVEGEAEEQELEDANHDESFESMPEMSGTQSSPIAIPKRKSHLGETELLSKSVPIIRSHIHDPEKSNFLHPLSCSLELNSDLLMKEGSSSSILEAKFEGTTSEADATIVDTQNKLEQGGTLISPAVELSLCKNLLFEGMGSEEASKVFDAEKEHAFEPQGMIAVDRDEKKIDGDASKAAVPSGGSWRLWPFGFKRSKTISSVPEGTNKKNEDISPMRSQSLVGDDEILRSEFMKKKVRSLTPTSEELASLNLKEGRNVVTFSFSTAMLGQQQVDARIYLWKWNTRVVISDVDGTITRSDVLGQFMPLVGVDWSQTGVTHLFSAIKENGYQLLFLSARAISQAHLTRQFLFNLKQDGKALPDGPVVISPDGLFPSLYREVIRRAPHEFKISCLEDIRALFPPERNPFYAGFGNRDTDEISYLKVGIPKGKIFIINPKGEVAMNHRVDTKSYTSLHALVHGMFPPMSSAEQEDFNSWNYWKLPLLDVGI